MQAHTCLNYRGADLLLYKLLLDFCNNEQFFQLFLNNMHVFLGLGIVLAPIFCHSNGSLKIGLLYSLYRSLEIPILALFCPLLKYTRNRTILSYQELTFIFLRIGLHFFVCYNHNFYTSVFCFSFFVTIIGNGLTFSFSSRA